MENSTVKVSNFVLALLLQPKRKCFNDLVNIIRARCELEDSNSPTIESLMLLVDNRRNIKFNSLRKSYYLATATIWERKSDLLRRIFPDTWSDRYAPPFKEFFECIYAYFKENYAERASAFGVNSTRLPASFEDVKVPEG